MQDLLEKAIYIASLHHAGQRYGDGPYILHPLRVMLRAQSLGKKAMVAAVLHDVVEDTRANLTDISREFGSEVCSLVERVTRREGETYVDFITRAGSELVTNRIKRLDIEDHLEHNPKKSLAKRYHKALDLLTELEHSF